MNILAIWLNAVNAGNVGMIVGLYEDTATLLPTFSNELIGSSEGRAAYFEKLLFECAEVSLVEARFEELSLAAGGVHQTAYGSYEFVYKNGGRVSARFTMTSVNGRIVHHHSSVEPSL